jgi:hypothetical protein
MSSRARRFSSRDPRQPKVDVIDIAWHSRQVFKGAATNEATDANP